MRSTVSASCKIAFSSSSPDLTSANSSSSAFALAEVVQGEVIYAEAIANEALAISFELRGEIVLFEDVATTALTLAKEEKIRLQQINRLAN